MKDLLRSGIHFFIDMEIWDSLTKICKQVFFASAAHFALKYPTPSFTISGRQTITKI